MQKHIIDAVAVGYTVLPLLNEFLRQRTRMFMALSGNFFFLVFCVTEIVTVFPYLQGLQKYASYPTSFASHQRQDRCSQFRLQSGTVNM